MSTREQMRDDWNKRAQENAYYWVLSGNEQWQKDAYYAQGEQDIERYVLPFWKAQDIDEKRARTLTALDIGCGTGRLCRALAKRAGKVIGVDISEEMITRAREDQRDQPTIEFRLSSGEDLGVIESGSIDFCFSFIVFQHIASKVMIRKYFREILRVLKPGGLAKIQVRGTPGNPPGKVLWFRGFDSFYVALTLWRGWLPLPWMRPYDSLFGACFSAGELGILLHSLGFSSITIFHEDDKYLWAELRKTPSSGQNTTDM